MSGDKIGDLSLDVVNASGVIAFADFGADDFHLRCLAYVRLRKEAARIDSAESRAAICVRGGQVVQSDFVKLLSCAVRDIPNACNTDSAEEENHHEKDQKYFDERAAGFGRSSGGSLRPGSRRCGPRLRRGLRRCLGARGT